MRYALIGDIHANFDALETVLADIETRSIDKIVCLGDVVGYGAEPARCLKKCGISAAKPLLATMIGPPSKKSPSTSSTIMPSKPPFGPASNSHRT